MSGQDDHAWLALVELRPQTCLAAAPLRGGGWLAAWSADDRSRADSAAKVDPRAIDPGGPSGVLAWTRAHDGSFLLFDDVMVTAAIRRAQAGTERTPYDVASSLLIGDSRCVGAFCGWLGDSPPDPLRNSPFAAMFSSRLLHVGAGLLGRVPSRAGPSGQRYGSAAPWPWDLAW